MDLIVILFGLGLVILCSLLHESGHFFIAEIFKRNAHFEFRFRGGFAPGLYTVYALPYTISNGRDLKRALKEEVKIAQAGLLSISAPLFLLFLYPELWQGFVIVIFLFMLYTIWEVGYSINANHLENVGEFREET
jgi:hypothetical protein